MAISRNGPAKPHKARNPSNMSWYILKYDEICWSHLHTSVWRNTMSFLMTWIVLVHLIPSCSKEEPAVITQNMVSMYFRYRVALRTLGSQEGHARWFRKDGTSTRGSAVSQDPFLPQLSNKVKDISWLLKVKFVHMRNKRLCWNRCCYEAIYSFFGPPAELLSRGGTVVPFQSGYGRGLVASCTWCWGGGVGKPHGWFVHKNVGDSGQLCWNTRHDTSRVVLGRQVLSDRMGAE